APCGLAEFVPAGKGRSFESYVGEEVLACRPHRRRDEEGCRQAADIEPFLRRDGPPGRAGLHGPGSRKIVPPFIIRCRLYKNNCVLVQRYIEPLSGRRAWRLRLT